MQQKTDNNSPYETFSLFKEEINSAIIKYINQCATDKKVIYGAFNDKHLNKHFFILNKKLISFTEHMQFNINELSLQDTDNDFALKIINQKQFFNSYQDALQFLQTKLKYITYDEKSFILLTSTLEEYFINSDIKEIKHQKINTKLKI